MTILPTVFHVCCSYSKVVLRTALKRNNHTPTHTHTHTHTHTLTSYIVGLISELHSQHFTQCILKLYMYREESRSNISLQHAVSPSEWWHMERWVHDKHLSVPTLPVHVHGSPHVLGNPLIIHLLILFTGHWRCTKTG